MKKAGDLLSAILDENILGKAREHSRLFSAWEHLNSKHGIAAAANHSRIQDIRLGVLVVEADHPGWIQILQTKENALLSDLQRSFPGLGISGIAFRLSRMPLGPVEETSGAGTPDKTAAKAAKNKPAEISAASPGSRPDETPPEKPRYEKIKDRELLEKLQSLEKNIEQL